MAEELDVDAMLEAPYKKGDEPSHRPKENGYADHRSSGKKRGPSRSRSREKESRSGHREKDRGERHRSRSRERGGGAGGEKELERAGRRERDRGERDGERDREKRSSRGKEKDRDRDGKKSHHRGDKSGKEKDRDSKGDRGSGRNSGGKGRSRSRSRERLLAKKSHSPPLSLGPRKDKSRSPLRRADRFGLGKKTSPSPLKSVPKAGLEELTPEERDARTVFCMQLSQRVRSRDLEEFFSSVGKVRDVRLITCNKTRRFKGISYVEFKDTETVPLALGLSGQKLLGIPIIVQPTQAEKNRQGVTANVLAQKGTAGPMRLYVGSLHFNITEDMLRGIFEPFGKIDNIQLIMDPETGRSKGYGFITFHDAEDAKKALEQLNGFELAGRPMKVGHVTERSDSASGPSILDSDELDRSGIDLGATGRLQLMAKLAEGTGLQIPQPAAAALNMNPLGGLASQPVAPPIATQCFMLSNMFDPQSDSNTGWDQEIRDDVIEECNKHGGVLHVYVDKASPQGNVYVKCPSIATAVAAIASLHGRWFAGRIITAAYVPLINYHNLFPDAMTTTQLLAPSSRRA